jgi:hypothetical protein
MVDEWTLENFHSTGFFSIELKFIVSVWVRIIDNCLIGLYMIANHFYGILCTDLLEIMFPILLKDIAFIFLQGHVISVCGIPPHFSHCISNLLNKTLLDTWINYGNPFVGFHIFLF